MARGKRNTEIKVRRPLLRIERIVYEKASFKMNRDVLANIEQYVLYLKEVTGDEPTQDEIVDRGMQRLFDADRGFRQWLQRKAFQDGGGSKIETASDVLKRTSAGLSSEKQNAVPE